MQTDAVPMSLPQRRIGEVQKFRTSAQTNFFNSISVIASCVANGQSSSNFYPALRDLRAI
jgi:hypothetical protein